jgi:hypothetical protein
LAFFDDDFDGMLGPQTESCIRDAQWDLKVPVDGKAGGLTQRAIAMDIAQVLSTNNHVPLTAPQGQLEHESGFRLGIYSPVRPDGTYDAGVAQRNTKFTPPQEGFNPELSILALIKNTRKHFELFEGLRTQQRRWALAQGAWNAPAFACFIAREEGAHRVTTGMTLKPSVSSRQTFEAYVTKVSKYLTV